MLDKDLCIKCIDNLTDAAEFQWNVDGGVEDEKIWTGGEVQCPNGTSVYIKDAPPKICPYKFEHGVAEGMQNAQ